MADIQGAETYEQRVLRDVRERVGNGSLTPNPLPEIATDTKPRGQAWENVFVETGLLAKVLAAREELFGEYRRDCNRYVEKAESEKYPRSDLLKDYAAKELWFEFEREVALRETLPVNDRIAAIFKAHLTPQNAVAPRGELTALQIGVERTTG